MAMGESMDIVVEVLTLREGHTLVRDLWFGCQCRILEVLEPGVWTLYGYIVSAEMGTCLRPCTGSKKFRKPSDPKSREIHIKELCVGIGGFSAGAYVSGFRTLAFLDHCDIACATISDNGGRALKADIAARESRIALHEIDPDKACMITAGFPCQPFSRQGDGRGFLDERAHTLTHVLLAIWFLQPEGAVLECVVEAERHPLVRTMLAELVGKLGWRQHHLVLELSDQWPCRRSRWWCLLVPADTPFQLEAWPRQATTPCIADVISEWPSWEAQAIEQLQWDEEETKHFLDPALGNDPRVLDLCGVAPTALHSWGSQLRHCPCGCRGPLSLHRLRTSGLRGFGVPFDDKVALRHPHPHEVGLLNGLSVRFVHQPDLRAALRLIGQIASPIQSCWIFAQVRQFRELRHGLEPLEGPMQALDRLKNKLLQEREDCWKLPSMGIPRELTFLQLGNCIKVKVTGAVQVKEVVRAEKQLQGPGSNIRIQAGSRVLGEDAYLHAQPSEPYVLCVSPKKQRPVSEHCHVLVCVPGGAIQLSLAQGALPCQVLSLAGLQGDRQLRFASTQEAVPRHCRLFGRHLLDARPLQQISCEPDELTDCQIASFLQVIARLLPEGHAVLLPRTASLLTCLQASGALQCMSGIEVAGATRLHIIAEANAHWYLLSVDWETGAAVHWDPAPERTQAEASALLAVLRDCLTRNQSPFAMIGSKVWGTVVVALLPYATSCWPLVS